MQLNFRNIAITAAVIIIAAVFVYTAAAHIVLSKNSALSVDYRDYIFAKTKGIKRIIIEGGSNTHHGINSSMIENAFPEYKVINLGDHGMIPLRDKLYRIMNNATENDIVIIIPEYTQFAYPEFHNAYYDVLLSEQGYYYGYKPMVEKFRTALHLPVKKLIQPSSKIKNSANKNLEYEKRWSEGDRGDYIFVNKAEPDADTLSNTCEEYLFYFQLMNGFDISSEFKKATEILRQIKVDKKIQIYFSWAAVAGENCYNGAKKDEIKLYIKQIVNYLFENEIMILGSPKDSEFAKELMNNTYYHVLPEARDMRTLKTIEEIKRAMNL